MVAARDSEGINLTASHQPGEVLSLELVSSSNAFESGIAVTLSGKRLRLEYARYIYLAYHAMEPLKNPLFTYLAP